MGCVPPPVVGIPSPSQSPRPARSPAIGTCDRGGPTAVSHFVTPDFGMEFDQPAEDGLFRGIFRKSDFDAGRPSDCGGSIELF